jgi:hypothetical protein
MEFLRAHPLGSGKLAVEYAKDGLAFSGRSIATNSLGMVRFAGKMLCSGDCCIKKVDGLPLEC